VHLDRELAFADRGLGARLGASDEFERSQSVARSARQDSLEQDRG
jgi:hypothetical protein